MESSKKTAMIVREYLEKKNLSQAEFVRQCNRTAEKDPRLAGTRKMTVEMLCYCLNGKRKFNLDYLVMISITSGISLQKLTGLK